MGILEFLKKRRVTTYLIAGALLFAIVGFILLLVTNSIAGYAMINVGGIIAAGIIAIVAIAAATYLSDRFGAKPWIMAILLVGMALLCLCFAFVLLNRVDIAAEIFSFDKGNLIAEKAFYTGATSIVFNLIAAIVLVVSSFLKFSAKE